MRPIPLEAMSPPEKFEWEWPNAILVYYGLSVVIPILCAYKILKWVDYDDYVSSMFGLHE
jgi:hypothetical protein